MANDWRQMAARMRGELDRADLSGRARRLAEFAVKVTLGCGRVRVVIPMRSDLCRLLRIGKTHVAEVSAALVSARIMRITEVADGWELLVYPDSAGWEVDWLYERDEMQRFLRDVNRAPGQCQGELIEPDPSLARTLAEVSAGNAARGYQNGNREMPAKPPSVTKMVTRGAPSFKNFKTPTERAFSLEDLKLKAVSENEAEAMEAFAQVIGHDVWEGIGREYADGAKWRLRWRQQRGKVQRVFADLLADMSEGKAIKTPGGRAEYIWKQF